MMELMNKAVMDKLKHFKVLFLDADGVFFDGQETRTVMADGAIIISKERSYLDGQGISFLRELGIKIVFVTGEGESLQSIVDKINVLPSVKAGRWQTVELFSKKNSKGAKLETINDWLKQNKLTLAEAAYMGDDINDLEPITAINQAGGLTIAPANATRLIKPIAGLVTKQLGGHGAIRELAESVLDARKVEEKKFPPA